jgi:hypothetical protein
VIPLHFPNSPYQNPSIQHPNSPNHALAFGLRSTFQAIPLRPRACGPGRCVGGCVREEGDPIKVADPDLREEPPLQPRSWAQKKLGSSCSSFHSASHGMFNSYAVLDLSAPLAHTEEHRSQQFVRSPNQCPVTPPSLGWECSLAAKVWRSRVRFDPLPTVTSFRVGDTHACWPGPLSCLGLCEPIFSMCQF